MKITILGCGSSSGVPLLGNDWGACNPHNPRNRRTRVSVLVEQGGQSLLIDTSPDMRQQLLTQDISNLAAVLFTHAHADHCHGIDELRAVNWLLKRPIPIYADAETMQDLSHRFAYIFRDVGLQHFFKPSIIPHVINGAFDVGDIHAQPFVQDHGYGNSMGFRIGDFAYSTDVKRFDDAAFATLQGVKVWVVDCVREKEHPTHAHFDLTMEWIARVKPERAYLTHMNQMMDYDAVLAKCPAGVEPAYDGLVIEC